MINLSVRDFKLKKDFLVYDLGKIELVFSTAEKDRSFNRHTEDGVNNLKSIIKDFDLSDIVYLNQIHSDKIYTYDKNYINIKDEEGDALITKEKNIAIGVFTADCVPIIIVNEKSNIVATIHSGWKGTFNSIALKTLLRMKDEFNIDINETKVFIGPHIRKCCYEISEELKEKFIEKTMIEEDKLFDGKNLSMQECILKDLREFGINENNIYSLNLCTHCEKNIKLYSYRKSVGTYGRLFSFAFIK
ncbi:MULTISPECIES: peptidoglycan editing factor PgeF [unclassified Clostridium]|uniref:peptidoglycan editing factor PgeF n=1 Tax=unclassified Clostridium TaxID=2614128 RepID=UPI00189AF186|nr:MULTISPECIES: peptidoglycan editing factor PgeF [unclassified Clostridium]MCR1951465.1 peptidoglycan editing factor PgeF [Clostridium sp. DSM 100503]